MKRAKFGYWGSLIAALVLMISVLASLATIRPVGAASSPATVGITIHKLKLTDNTTITNNGLEQGNIGPTLQDAGFTVYNVSKQFYAEYTGKNGDELVARYTNDLTSLGNYQDGLVGSEQLTGPTGQASWTSLPAKTELDSGASVDSVYLILETTVPGTVTSGAQPMIVALPVKNPAGAGTLSNIHLYPKNYGIDKVLLDEEGNAATDTQRYEVGHPFTYQAKFTVPSNITSMKEFRIWDAFEGSGVVYDGIDSVTVNGDSSKDYLADFNAHSSFVFSGANTRWDYNFNLNDANAKAFYASLAGKTITVKYSAHITEDAVPDVAVGNKFYVNYTTDTGNKHELEDDSTKVTTGGHKFKKVSSTTGATLKGAEFVVRNATDKYALVAHDKVTWVDDRDDATTYTSGEAGKVVVKGLADGTYELVETAAPDGYQTMTKTTGFTIVAGSFGEEKTIDVKNDPNTFGYLPMTGGMGWVLFILAGVGLMGVAMLMMRRRNTQA